MIKPKKKKRKESNDPFINYNLLLWNIEKGQMWTIKCLHFLRKTIAESSQCWEQTNF